MSDSINQTQNVLVSVCLVTYNQKRFIKDAVESALIQKTNFEYEIVIGDDCSTDGTQEICADYASKHPSKIKVLKREKNLGLLMNFVETIKECRGELIAYLEGDDYWLTDNKLQRQTEILLKDQDVSLVHTNWKNYLVEDNILKDSARVFKGRCKSETTKGIAGVETFLSNGYGGIRASSVMFRKDNINEIINKNYDIFKDRDIKTFDYFIFCHFTHKGFFRFINEDTTLYRLNPGSISVSANIEKQIEFSFGILKAIINILKFYNISNKPDFFFNRVLSSLLKACVDKKDYDLFNKIERVLSDGNINIQMRHNIIIFCIKHHMVGTLRFIIYISSFLKNSVIHNF